MSRASATQAVTIIFSAYGQVKAEQEAFQRLAVQALEDYPDKVLVELVSPKTGIIAKSKFPPSIAELHEWCRDKQSELEHEQSLKDMEKERLEWLRNLDQMTRLR